MPLATLVHDSTDLVDGIANLATTYFDTTSHWNDHHKGAKMKHFSFQTVKGLDWKDAVTKMLAGETFTKESGEESILKTVVKQSIGFGVAGEVNVSQAIVGALTDFVIDSAVEHFKKPAVQEVYEKGAWVIVFRGHDHSKTKRTNELYSETAMFGDFDDVLQHDEEAKLYSPGFYISRAGETKYTAMKDTAPEYPFMHAE